MKKDEKQISLFQGNKIRKMWDEEKEKWYFSVVDVVAALINQLEHKKAKSYWSTLKNRLNSEGSEVVTNCDHLRMKAMDGKYYMTDVADTETIFRLIQSIPSPNAEPFKL
ncbi:MAG: BRO family protein, partial [Weeksellaceae bacterium]|nr:BRO family protein [Weeksellaceae bacterium]